MAGVAIYIDPEENTNIIGEGHEDIANNVTSVDGVKDKQQLENSTEIVSTVHALNLTVKTKEQSSENKTDFKNIVDENLDSLESWSSSMAAAGNLSRSPGSSHRNTSRVPESAE